MRTLGCFLNGLLSSKRALQKNEWSKSCGQTIDFQSRLCSFLAQNSNKEATDHGRNGPTFP
jgi:hypothetical protein